MFSFPGILHSDSFCLSRDFLDTHRSIFETRDGNHLMYMYSLGRRVNCQLTHTVFPLTYPSTSLPIYPPTYYLSTYPPTYYQPTYPPT